MDVGRFNGKAGELDLRDGAVIGMRISGGAGRWGLWRELLTF
jgi:hypothetical protein